MKKRLLITSIVMMLVVAVALSTATYAWFTSNNAVTANTVSLTAGTSNAPSLGISWYNGDFGTTISAVYPDQEGETDKAFFPACPENLVKDSTTSAITFRTATATPANDGDMKFNNDVDTTDVYTWTDNLAGTGHNSFFLKNMSPANTMGTITMTATIEGDGSSLIRVGVFKYDTTSSTYKLQEVLANQEANTYTVVAGATEMDNATTYYKLYLGKYIEARKGTSEEVTAGTADWYAGMTASASSITFYTVANTATNAKAVYGTPVATQSVNALSGYTCATSVVLANSLDAGDTIELVVLVWEDAVALGDNEQGQSASITLNFTAAAYQAPSEPAGD